MNYKSIKERARSLDGFINPYVSLLPEYENIIKPEDVTHLRDICLEIGSGSGKFLSNYAKEKDFTCLGIELRYKRLVLAANKSRSIENLRWCRCEASSFLDLLAEESLREVHVYFPDPWPKKRHLKNRLMSLNFLQKLKSKMRPSAHLFFKTDHEDYFTFARENISQLFQIVEESKDLYRKREIGENSTEFENLFFYKKKKIFYLLAKTL